MNIYVTIVKLLHLKAFMELVGISMEGSGGAGAGSRRQRRR
jgi:hypothetical protein